MKITSVDVIRTFKEPSIPAEVAVGNVPWHPVFVRINTDEGISGLGEVGVAYGNAQTAGFGHGSRFCKVHRWAEPYEQRANMGQASPTHVLGHGQRWRHHGRHLRHRYCAVGH